MSDAPETSTGPSTMELELYFLIVKFLSRGPCRRAAEVLAGELIENKLLPKRVDWEGAEHFRSFENLLDTNRHIAPTHLLKICQRIIPLLNQDVRASVSGVMSLLGAGRQSILRTEEDVKFISWSPTTHVVLHHGQPLIPPSNLRHPPNIVHIAYSRQLTSRARLDHAMSHQVYSHIAQLSRSLGHLSAVYCVTFDRTGLYIITGADDNLVKVWSAGNGRLLCTLRGHAAEITDIACSYNNRLLATASCDKLIRIWSLQTSEPAAVLHAHTHMVTSVRFSPYARGDTRYLASTGSDGCLCIWEYNVVTNKFNSKPVKFIERSRAGTQMLCSSFSPGGVFLATGSSDHVIRVYCLSGHVPEKICELEAHMDRIDTIQYANGDARFVSSSKDGTARVWRFERQEWRAIIIDASLKLNESAEERNADDCFKYQVTMASWSTDDQYVVTAVNDHTLKVWNSYSGQLCKILQGHTDEVFVLEHNPADPRILLSAGHDGNIILWDIIAGLKIKTFYNTIEGQGHGAVFDCKWSPDGQSFAATDSHGFLCYFGFGSNDRYKKLPDEVFFHTDYRPLIRDSNNYVLDEQTQHPPHVMPPPFLVDIDGNPYPPRYQRLVPGREECVENQLVPLVAVTPSGDREVLDDIYGAFQDVAANEINPPPDAIGNGLDDRPMGGEHDRPMVGEHGVLDRPIIDEMIARMQVVQDQRLLAEGRQPLAAAEHPAVAQANAGASGSVSRRARYSHDTTSQQHGARSVRESAGGARPGTSRERSSSPPGGGERGGREVSQRSPSVVHAANMSVWLNRVLVRELNPSLYKASESWRHEMSAEEMKSFFNERKRKPLAPSEVDSSDSGSYIKTRTHEKYHHRGNYKGGGGREGVRRRQNEETGKNRLLTRALYDTETEEGSSDGGTTEVDEDDEIPAGVLTDPDENIHEQQRIEEEELENGASTDGESTVYSDWLPEGGETLQPPKRQSQRQVKRKRWTRDITSDQSHESSAEEEEPDEEEEEFKVKVPRKRHAPCSSPSPRQPSPKRKVTRRQKQQRKVLCETTTTEGGVEIHELPPEFRPPEWLTSAVPRKAPYFPQMGDEVIYFLQGHQQYVEAVKTRNAYAIDSTKKQPWEKLHLREQELLKVVGIKYEIRPPRLVCLKLAFIDPDDSRPTGQSFTIKYHDMPDVIDFVVLRQTYETAMSRNWSEGDRFRCLIDDTWWCGTIRLREPLQEEYPDSQFQCIHVHWDNSEDERLSPWDLEPIDETHRTPVTRGSSVPVNQAELSSLAYMPRSSEWPACGRAAECDRIVRGMEQIMELSISESFLVPVDLNDFPLYAIIIEYPIDLSTIKQRLENRFYRRVTAIQYDVRHIEANARAFNKPNSSIVKYAKLVTELTMRLVSDETCTDVMPLYSSLAKDANFSVLSRSSVGTREEESGGEEEIKQLGEGTSSRHHSLKSKMSLRSSNGTDGRTAGDGATRHDNSLTWQEQCQRVLDTVLDSADSVPFTTPVSLETFPNYLELIDDPMDFETISLRLQSDDFYQGPVDFLRDMRLVFNNSRSYNTNKRSKIFAMTLRLSALFEEQYKSVVSETCARKSTRRHRSTRSTNHGAGQSSLMSDFTNIRSSKGCVPPSRHPTTQDISAVGVGSRRGMGGGGGEVRRGGAERFRRQSRLLGHSSHVSSSHNMSGEGDEEGEWNHGGVVSIAGREMNGTSYLEAVPRGTSRLGHVSRLGHTGAVTAGGSVRSGVGTRFTRHMDLLSARQESSSQHSNIYPVGSAQRHRAAAPSSHAAPCSSNDTSPIKSRRIRTRTACGTGATSRSNGKYRRLAHYDSDATECDDDDDVEKDAVDENDDDDNDDEDFRVNSRGSASAIYRRTSSPRKRHHRTGVTNGHRRTGRDGGRREGGGGGRERGDGGRDKGGGMYSTRCATGSIKRKHYDVDDEVDSTGGGGLDNDEQDEDFTTLPRRPTTKTGKRRRVVGGEAKEDEEEEEVIGHRVRLVQTRGAKSAGRGGETSHDDTSECSSTDDGDKDEDGTEDYSDDDDDDDDDGGRHKRSAVLSSSRRHGGGRRKDGGKRGEAREGVGGGRYGTRNRGQRTVRYQFDSDEEGLGLGGGCRQSTRVGAGGRRRYNEEGEGGSEGEDSEEGGRRVETSVSSRGRLRKPKLRH